ncbi:ATPase WRNIP1 isoform X2 [Eurytemora carolleeae]|uniref:ATPase WRNIP1 isoform X2 n=1 Tax=Eurytemora carolleeae TaxID=1294199 RepID=UPI000C784B43|nr:ATPase WRNIP1 isoform X2 [Eurytemora carolleeae]|eukprot:XP_023335284.1 ATPase WRNIP1-like isoform X2 [Eurytemora affinis]
MEDSVECPLCAQSFSKTNIQTHASTCGMESKKPLKRTLSDIFGHTTKKDQTKKPRLDEPAKEVFCPSPGLKPKSSMNPAPLAERMRPQDLSTYIGQESVVGASSQLRKLLEAETIPSLVLWGPPGCGKTSLANVIANKVKGKCKFVKMSACTCGVNEVREVVKQAKNEQAMFKRNTILFMDEVHRFNKAQQDTFLPHIESEKLSPESLRQILERALGENNIKVVEKLDKDRNSISDESITYLTNIVDGDARSALNTLQLLINSREANSHIDLEQVKEAAKRSHVLYDRKGDEHFFMASALQKSIRGSDDNAALYWFGRMIKGGEDPTFIARRLVRIASEDVGLGDPSALPLAVAAFQGTQLIGKPECDVLLAHATVHLARAKKSHEIYNALNAVYSNIDQGVLPPVPLHLRNSTSRATTELGWGKGYSANLEKVQSISYLPEELKGVNFFNEKNGD